MYPLFPSFISNLLVIQACDLACVDPSTSGIEIAQFFNKILHFSQPAWTPIIVVATIHILILVFKPSLLHFNNILRGEPVFFPSGEYCH